MSDIAIPLDTSRQAHARQRDVYLRLGGSGRVAVMFQLNDAMRRLANGRNPRQASRLRRGPGAARVRASGAVSGDHLFQTYSNAGITLWIDDQLLARLPVHLL
jgi:hypothetical protein